MHWPSIVFAFSLVLGGVLVHAHVQMMQPYPLRSKFDKSNNDSDVDYSMTSPLLADGSNFPCKGYQNDRPVRTTATYEAGSTYLMKLDGSAMHDGGSCQISLSYDNGMTFRVIKSIIGGCPMSPGEQYHFTVPSYAPNGTALLAWSWVNLVGNREYYMNCAEVEVVDSAQVAQTKRNYDSKRRRADDQFSNFLDLPYLWKANLEGVNDCHTAEGVNVVYPQPGPDVVYGAGLSANSPVTEGVCNSPKPYGATYKDLST